MSKILPLPVEDSWFLYVLKCADGTLYTGISNRPDYRLKVHNSGRGAKYTRSRLPVSMLVCQSVGSKRNALRLEYAFKKLSRSQKLSHIETDLLVFLSKDSTKN